MTGRKVIQFIAMLGVLLLNTVAQAIELEKGQYMVFYHADALGSPLATTDHNGNVIAYEYRDPFGRSRGRYSNTGQAFGNQAVSGNNVGYTGHVDDSATGLVYMRARYFDPMIGRFYSNDRIGFNRQDTMSFNRYSYGRNNPFSYIDPDGNTAVVTIGKDEFRVEWHLDKQKGIRNGHVSP